MSLKVFPYQLKKQINEIKNNYFYPSLKSLNGNILEIGFGKGDNFEYYPDDSKIYAIEKTEKLLINGNNHFKKKNLILKKGTAENLTFENEFFDAVVFSFVLCSVNSIDKSSIQETKRVLKKGGRIILLEHIKSKNKISLAIQKTITAIQTLFISCHMDRDPRPFLKENFKIIREEFFDNSLEPYLFMELIKE